MKGRLAHLLLALTVAAAAGLVSASAAVALEFPPDQAIVMEGEAESNQTFEVTSEGPEVQCSSAEFKGRVGGEENTLISVTPTYPAGKCTHVAGLVDIDFATDGCGYLIELQEGESQAVVQIKCAEGGDILMTPTVFGTSVCSLHIPPQTVGGVVDLEEVAEDEITAELTLTEVDQDRTGNSACGPAESTTGTAAGSIRFKVGKIVPSVNSLVFKAVNEVKTFSLENKGLLGKVPLHHAWIQHFIGAGGETTEEPNFEIVEAIAPACPLPGEKPFHELNKLESCKVAIKSLKKGKSEQYWVISGTPWFSTPWGANIDLVSP